MTGKSRPSSQQPRGFHLIKCKAESAAIDLPQIDGDGSTQRSLAKLAGDIAHPQFALREYNITLDRTDHVVVAPAHAVQRKPAAADGLSIRSHVPKGHIHIQHAADRPR